MRSKSVLLMAAMVVVVLMSSSAFGQIQWYDGAAGVTLTNAVPGDSTDATLKIILGENSQLTNGQFLYIDISSFHVTSASDARDSSNFSITAPTGSLLPVNMDNDGSDFDVSYDASTQIITIELTHEDALVPGDSVWVNLNNFLINPGKGTDSGTPNDYTFYVYSTDQPLPSQDTYNEHYTATQDIEIATWVQSNDIASNATEVTVTTTTTGYLPGDGKLKLFFPAGYTFETATYDSVFVTAGAAELTVDAVTIDGSARTILIALGDASTTGTVEGTTLTVRVGGSGTNYVNNPPIYTSGGNATVNFTAGSQTGDFTLVGMGVDSDTIFVDVDAGTAADFDIYSNWFALESANSGKGGVSLSDNRAGVFSKLDLYFKVSSDIDSVSATDVDTLVFSFPTTEFTFDSSAAETETNYTFSTGFDDDSTFGVDATQWASGKLKFYAESVNKKLSRNTDIQLTIASGVVRNKAATSDVTVSLYTSNQTTAVDDRDSNDPIIINPGASITRLLFIDSSASEPSGIDSLIFTAAGYIPSDGQIAITFPGEFVMSSQIDSIIVMIDSANAGTMIDVLTASSAYPTTGVNEVFASAFDVVSTGNNTIVNSEVILKFNSNVTKNFVADSRIMIVMLGDTTNNGISTKLAGFTNPAPADVGTYPTTGTYAPLLVSVRDNNGNDISSGTNDADGARVKIRTNDWGFSAYTAFYTPYNAGGGIDSQAVFIATDLTQDTYADSAGHGVGLRIFFSMGAPLIGGAHEDTLFIGLNGAFGVDPVEAAQEANFDFIQGTGINGATTGIQPGDMTTGYNSTTDELWIAPLANTDSIMVDSLVVLHIEEAGSDATKSGGILWNKGYRNDGALLTLRSNRQENTVAMDSSSHLTVVPDSLWATSIVKGDSVVSETSSDSLILTWRQMRLDPGSYLTFDLATGNSWNDNVETEANTTLKSYNGIRSYTNFTITKNSSTQIKLDVAATDTIGGWGLDFNDTLSISFGGGGSDVITNRSAIADSGRIYRYGGDVVLGKLFTVNAYDANDSLIMTHKVNGDVSSADQNAQPRYVSNVFAGGSLVALGFDETLDGTAFPDTAGQLIDTLLIPFQVGESLIGDGTVGFSIKVQGMRYTNSVTAELAANWELDGDNNITGFLSINAANNDSVHFTLNNAETVGGVGAATLVAFQDTLRAIGVFTFLGNDTSGTDSLNVSLSTSSQSIPVADTTRFNLFTFSNAPTTLALSSAVAGANSDQTTTFATGLAHGTVFGDSKIKIKFPVSQDSVKTHTNGTGFYGYSTQTPSLANGSTVSATVSGGLTGGLTALTETAVYNLISSATPFTADALYDTAVVTITLNDANTVAQDSTLVIALSSTFKNPAEATDGVAATALSTWNNGIVAIADYGVVIEILDANDNLISRSTKAPAAITVDAASGYLVMNAGEKHDPGEATDGVFGAPTSYTAADGVLFNVALVDAYNNIIGTHAVDNITLTTYTGTDLDSQDQSYIGDGNGATAGNLQMAVNTGQIDFDDVDSLRVHRAGSGNTSIGQAAADFKTIKADGAQTGTSNNFSVIPGVHARTLVLVEGETEVPGDSVSVGKENTGQNLVAGGTYDVTVYPVDLYYNRVDTSHGGSATLVVSAPGITVSSNPVAFSTSTYSATFTIVPGTQGTNQYVTVTDGSFAGTTTFDVIGGIIDAVFTALADSTELAGRFMPFTVELTYSGEFAASGGWKFYTHNSPSLTTINASTSGALLAESGVLVKDGSAHVDTAYTVANLNEGQLYYIYAVLPEINDSVVTKSDSFMVTHYPLVDEDMTGITPSTADDNVNSSGTSSKTINFQVVDMDDGPGEVPVYIYIDEDGTLDESDWDPTTLDFGTNSIRLTESGTDALDLGDTSFLFDITSTLPNGSTRTPYGDYYVYIAAVDVNGNEDVARSDYILTVKHSPTITLDRPLAGTTNIDSKDQKYLTINWTTSGDGDIDDNATIAVYYDTTSNNWTTVSGLVGSATAVQLTSGFELTEDGDLAEDDQYVVDLTSLSSADLPVDGDAYDFYALITDTRDTVLSKSAGDVIFTHSPSFSFNFNLGLGIGKGEVTAGQMVVDKGEVLQIAWEAFDLDNVTNQFIRLVISQMDPDINDYDELDAQFGVQSWIMNSSNGEAGVNADTTVITETSIDWYSGNMKDLSTAAQNGDYYVYAFVSNNGSNAAWSSANTDKFVASGKVRLTNLESTVSTKNIAVIPSVVAVTKGDVIRFNVVLNSGSAPIDQFGIFIDVDTTYFSVNSPESPFTYNSTDHFMGGTAAVEDTAYADGSVWKINFAKALGFGGTAVSNQSIGYFEVTAKESAVNGTVEGQFVFSNDLANSRATYYSSGGIKSTGAAIANPAVRLYSNPLGRVEGFVPLQGRSTNNAATITFELREPGSLLPITDSNFRSTNDQDATTDGVQVVTDALGAYTLTQIPSGSYYLVANATSYLSGQYQDLDVRAGDIISGVQPTYDNSAIPVERAQLDGGDVSSGLVPGTGDNVVESSDINYLISNYNVDVVSGDPTKAIGDINNDGKIEFNDLLIASGNYLREGIPPVFNKQVAGNNENAKFDFQGIPDELVADREFTVELTARDINDMQGFSFILNYDAEKLELADAGIEEGAFLRSGRALAETEFFQKAVSRGTEVVNTLKGAGELVTGEGVLARITFRSKVDDGNRPNIDALDVRVGNSAGELARFGDITPLPDKFKLAQNYPNPFNPETRIKFELPNNTFVTLKVFNILGQEVTTLVNRDMRAGFQSIKWNGRNRAGVRVASGVYIYELKTSEFTMAKKMMLIK